MSDGSKEEPLLLVAVAEPVQPAVSSDNSVGTAPTTAYVPTEPEAPDAAEEHRDQNYDMKYLKYLLMMLPRPWDTIFFTVLFLMCAWDVAFWCVRAAYQNKYPEEVALQLCGNIFPVIAIPFAWKISRSTEPLLDGFTPVLLQKWTKRTAVLWILMVGAPLANAGRGHPAKGLDRSEGCVRDAYIFKLYINIYTHIGLAESVTYIPYMIKNIRCSRQKELLTSFMIQNIQLCRRISNQFLYDFAAICVVFAAC